MLLTLGRTNQTLSYLSAASLLFYCLQSEETLLSSLRSFNQRLFGQIFSHGAEVVHPKNRHYFIRCWGGVTGSESRNMNSHYQDHRQQGGRWGGCQGAAEAEANSF